MRIKILRSFGIYSKDQVVSLDKSEAELLIKKGVAIMTKDIVTTDIKVKTWPTSYHTL